MKTSPNFFSIEVGLGKRRVFSQGELKSMIDKGIGEEMLAKISEPGQVAQAYKEKFQDDDFWSQVQNILSKDKSLFKLTPMQYLESLTPADVTMNVLDAVGETSEGLFHFIHSLCGEHAKVALTIMAGGKAAGMDIPHIELMEQILEFARVGAYYISLTCKQKRQAMSN